ncbi:MAG: ScpA family protein [Gammaproteobacteria bacterium]|nr:ScpA family protein [Gammaproteobacteria bacterium]
MGHPEDPHPGLDRGAGEARASTAIHSTVLVNGEALEHWPRNLTIHPDALEVFLDSFQGPLDLLLYLIRKQNQDILDIPVADITRQYMEYVELMGELRLDLASEYLVMAAILAEMKSRMILFRPASDADDEEDPRTLLVQRLQEYERFNQASQDMDKLPRIERELYLVSAEFQDPEPVKVEFQASLNDLSIAFRNVLERSELNRNFSIGREGLTVREKMTHILGKTRHQRFVRFEDLFDPGEGRAGLVVCFMAILELVRDNMLVVVQNRPFAPIHIQGIGQNR